MGLDIYLYHYDVEPSIVIENERAFEAACEKNWKKMGKYESLTQEQKDKVNAQNDLLKEKFGIDDYTDKRSHKIEQDSTKYPDHLFKIGYFRSSYNGGGFNRVVPNLGLSSLNDIFSAPDEYMFTPDWEKAKENALQTARDIREVIQKGHNLRCAFVSANIFGAPRRVEEEKAIAMVQEQLSKTHDPEWSSFSNQDGEFFLNGMTILAAIPGIGVLNQQGVNLIFRDDSLDWYAKACEIIGETCDYVLTNPGHYNLHWSG